MNDSTRPVPAAPSGAADGERSPSGRIVIRNLDHPGTIPDGGDDERILWICLRAPQALAGALLVPEEFEGAWLEGGSAWFRIGGATLGPFRVPDGPGPETARDWLTGELARQVPGARAELAGFRIAGAGSTSISQPKSH